MRQLAALAFLVPVALVACSSDDILGGKSCALADCSQGIEIAFTETQAGTYAIELVIDGTTSTCTATLPLSGDANPCTSPDVLLTRSGSALPAAQQSIGGLRIMRTDAKSVTVRVTRDGTSVRDATFTPSYVVTPGPNGPGCAPETCTNASFTLP